MTRTSEALRLAWCVLAGVTFAAAVRVWYPIHVAARLLPPDADPPLRVWSKAQARAMGCFVVVAATNLLAGVYSYSVPLRPDLCVCRERSRLGCLPLVVPALFIVSAIFKLAVVYTIWRAYQRVVAASASSPRPSAAGRPQHAD